MDDDYKQVAGEEVAKAQKEPGRERRSTTLGQLPFIQHSAETVAALSRFDRGCLRFLRFVVARRVIACCLITAFYVILAGTGVALDCLDLSSNYQYEWVIDAKRSTRNHDARQAAVAAADPLAATDTAPRAREYLPTWVEYETTSHIFTPANLQKICDVEMNFYSAPTYQSVCVAHDGACAAPATSALTAFYGAEHLQRLNATCELLEDDFVEGTWRTMVAAANASTAGRLAHGMFMAKGAIVSGVSTKTRSLLYVGAPLEGFTSITDRAAEQYDVYNAYVEAVEARLWTHVGVESTLFRSAYLEPWVRGGLRFRSFSFFLYRLEWIRLQEMDSLWMVAAILFVALWIRVHTGSLRFSIAATAQILLSIPVTALVYRFVLGFEYFAFLHLCSIFVVRGCAKIKVNGA